MAMESKKANIVVEEEYNNRPETLPRKPYRISLGAALERWGTRGLLSQMVLQAVGKMEYPSATQHDGTAAMREEAHAILLSFLMKKQ
jgi:hypothetical protein